MRFNFDCCCGTRCDAPQIGAGFLFETGATVRDDLGQAFSVCGVLRFIKSAGTGRALTPR